MACDGPHIVFICSMYINIVLPIDGNCHKSQLLHVKVALYTSEYKGQPDRHSKWLLGSSQVFAVPTCNQCHSMKAANQPIASLPLGN